MQDKKVIISHTYLTHRMEYQHSLLEKLDSWNMFVNTLNKYYMNVWKSE